MSLIKKTLLSIYKILDNFHLFEVANRINDYIIFNKYSFGEKEDKKGIKLKESIIKEYHIVEKGLSLPTPRIGFGKKKIPQLISDTYKYIKENGEDNLVLSIKATLSEYIEFNKSQGEDLSSSFYQDILSVINFIKGENGSGGTKMINKNLILEHTKFDYLSFLKSRSSIRNFSEKNITLEEIYRATTIAKNAPSVCNRQNWKAHVYISKKQIDKLLKYQNGNNGFGFTFNKLVIITCDIQGFTKKENNQVYIDGGIFSLSFILALHSIGIGSCALNTCINFWTENTIKKIGKINSSERVIMMIGIGHLKETFKVAISEKKHNDNITIIHQ